MTQYVGVIGYPLRHTLSPVFQQAGLDELGLDVRYQAWETPPAALSGAVAALRGPDRMGMNVTIPHKQAVIPLLDRVDVTAQAIGAVNTVAKVAGALVGYNTDCTGFLRALRQDGGFEPAGRRALVLGAGGAARAVLYALIDAGAARVGVAARRRDQAAAAIEYFGRGGAAAPLVNESWGLPDLVTEYDLVVNTTPMGMLHGAGEHASPLAGVDLPAGVFVYDLVYNPSETPLLRQARAAGARNLGGLSMLVYQGAVGFEYWTGRPAPVATMLTAARRALYGPQQ
jgi:shikimate dehydrogenase